MADTIMMPEGQADDNCEVAPPGTSVDFDIMPFPLDALPIPFRRFVMEASNAMQCEPDFIGALLLPVVGAAIGNRCRLKLKKGFNVVAAFYLALVAPPGTGKSPAFQLVGAPLHVRQRHLRDRYEKELRKWETAQRKEEGDASPRPILERIVTEDATVEALGSLLAQNDGGLILWKDELSSWGHAMNSYKGGKGADRQFYLSAWSQSPITIDRKTQPEPLFIDHPFLSISGSIQPDVVRSLVQAEANDGFLDRILFSYPKTRIPLNWSEDTVSDETQATVIMILNKLFDLAYSADEPLTVTLDSEATVMWRSWYAQHQSETREEVPENMIGVWAKMPIQCGRLVLAVHMARWAVGEAAPKDVDAESMKSGIELTEYFKNHGTRVHSIVRETVQDMPIRRTLQWLDKTRRREVRARDVLNAKIVGSAAAATAVLDALEKAGAGQWVELSQSSNGRHRPPMFRLTGQP